MFNALEKVAVATVGTTGLFLAAYKLKALPGYFMAPSTSPLTSGAVTDPAARRQIQEEDAQQRVNSFAAGIIAGGIATGLVLAVWRK